MGLGDLSLDVFILLLRPAGLGNWRALGGSICTRCLMFLPPGAPGKPTTTHRCPFPSPGAGHCLGAWGLENVGWSRRAVGSGGQAPCPVGARLLGLAIGRAPRGVQPRALQQDTGPQPASPLTPGPPTPHGQAPESACPKRRPPPFAPTLTTSPPPPPHGQGMGQVGWAVALMAVSSGAWTSLDGHLRWG